MSRGGLLLVAVLAAAGAAILWCAGGDEPAATQRETTERDATEPAERNVGTAGPRERPELDPDEPATDDTGVPTYVTEDGRVVRDHRKNPRGPLTRPLARPAREKSDPVARATLGRLRLAIRPGVKRCAREHAGSYGDDAVLQVVVYADIEDGVATASGLEMQGDAGDEMESCVRELVEALRVDVPGAPDRSGYPMTFPFDLGPLRE